MGNKFHHYFLNFAWIFHTVNPEGTLRPDSPQINTQIVPQPKIKKWQIYSLTQLDGLSNMPINTNL